MLDAQTEPHELAVEAQDSLLFSTGSFVLQASMQHRVLFSGAYIRVRICLGPRAGDGL
jgi:hypothetical protein